MGFKLTKDTIVPADSMTESIRNFPEPHNITGARAFFKLEEQVSFTLSKCDNMVALRHLLSFKVTFFWTEELALEFVFFKEKNVEQIYEGVRMFKVLIITAMSQTGAQYVRL